jgi:hypothetical protein
MVQAVGVAQKKIYGSCGGDTSQTELVALFTVYDFLILLVKNLMR